MQGIGYKMSRNNDPLILFNPSLPRLSKNEKAVLELLVEAGKLIAPLYLEQEKQIKREGSFYPKGISKKEIEKAAKKDPAILSHYTVVEKMDGKLVAIPYYVKYASLLKPIAEKLNKASEMTESKEFSQYLKTQVKALIDGSHKEAMIASLKMKPYILDIYIGPIEYVDDQLFFTKTTFQCWVGVIDKSGTERLNNYKSIILSTERRALIPAERMDNYDKVKAKVLDVVLFSGLVARTRYVGTCLPLNIDIVEKYGSEVTLFNQPNDLRMEKEIIPFFRKMFPTEFKQSFDFEDLRRASLRYIAMHELAHSFLNYRHAKEKLKDLFIVICELAATVLGFRVTGSLLLKNRINDKQLESMIMTVLCRSFYLAEKERSNRSLTDHTIGGMILINYLLESGALKELDGIIVPNFMKIFISLQNLYSILENLLSKGNYIEAEKFVKTFGSRFKKFDLL